MALIGVVAVLFAVTLTYALVRASSGGKGVSFAVGQTRFTVGNADELNRRFQEDPVPRLLPDVSGDGQRRPVILAKTGTDPEQGWVIVDANPPGAPDDCFFQPTEDRTALVAPCTQQVFPADGAGLASYPWEVTADGSLVVDLRRP